MVCPHGTTTQSTARLKYMFVLQPRSWCFCYFKLIITGSSSYNMTRDRDQRCIIVLYVGLIHNERLTRFKANHMIVKGILGIFNKDLFGCWGSEVKEQGGEQAGRLYSFLSDICRGRAFWPTDLLSAVDLRTSRPNPPQFPISLRALFFFFVFLLFPHEPKPKPNFNFNG